jgi:Tol biopolymer transport system component
MKTRNLIIILIVLLLINAAMVYFLLYFDPSYRSLNITPATSMGMAWNKGGDTLAYYAKKDKGTVIAIHDFIAKTTRTIQPLPGLDTASSLSFSPNDNYLAYYRKSDSKNKNVEIVDANSGKSILTEIFSAKQKLLITDSGGPKDAIQWLDDRRIVFVNSFPFERIGVIFLNTANGNEERFIDRVYHPALSTDRKYLAYVTLQEKSFSVHKLNLETNQTNLLHEAVGNYVYNLSWSPDDSFIAVSYLDNDGDDSLHKVAILKKEGGIITLGGQMELSASKWLSEDYLLTTRYISSGDIFKSKSVSGLYLYGLKNNTIRLISKRVRFNDYYPRPKTHQVLYQFGNNLEYVDIDRILTPTVIDAWRKKLGINSN